MVMGLALAMGLAGCKDSGPTLDGSSEEAFEQSLEVMMEGGTDEDAKAVELAAKMLTLKALHDMSRDQGNDDDMTIFTLMMLTQAPGAEEEAISRMLKELDGKSFEYLKTVPDNEKYADYKELAQKM